jgi:hypothetical protein
MLQQQYPRPLEISRRSLLLSLPHAPLLGHPPTSIDPMDLLLISIDAKSPAASMDKLSSGNSVKRQASSSNNLNAIAAGSASNAPVATAASTAPANVSSSSPVIERRTSALGGIKKVLNHLTKGRPGKPKKGAAAPSVPPTTKEVDNAAAEEEYDDAAVAESEEALAVEAVDPKTADAPQATLNFPSVFSKH